MSHGRHRRRRGRGIHSEDVNPAPPAKASSADNAAADASSAASASNDAAKANDDD
jgi:hypothetical protein